MGKLCHHHDLILEIVGRMKFRLVDDELRMFRVILMKIQMKQTDYPCIGNMGNHGFGGLVVKGFRECFISIMIILIMLLHWRLHDFTALVN